MQLATQSEKTKENPYTIEKDVNVCPEVSDDQSSGPRTKKPADNNQANEMAEKKRNTSSETSKDDMHSTSEMISSVSDPSPVVDRQNSGNSNDGSNKNTNK